MTEIKISYNGEDYTLEQLVQKLYSSEEKIKELQNKVNAYTMADAINTAHRKWEEEYVRKVIKENLNKCCCDSYYEKVSDALMERSIDSLKESISLKEENIRLKKRIDELEEEKSAIAWMGVILALMNNNKNK